jgi:dolichol-phosphate mannosyltransferase
VLAQDPKLEVLVVDDASPDGTGDLVETARKSEPRLHLMRRAGKLGLGSAYLAGFRHALENGYELVLTMDCDGSHNPRYLPQMLARADYADLVIGSRYVPGGDVVNWPKGAACSPARESLHAHARRAGARRTGPLAARRSVLETVDPFTIRGSGYSFLEEMVYRVHRCGFTIAEVPIVFEQRTHGVSKIDEREIYRAAWHVLVTAVRRPDPRKR